MLIDTYQGAPKFVFNGSMIKGITRPPILIPLDRIPRAAPLFFTNHNGTTLRAIYIYIRTVVSKFDGMLVYVSKIDRALYWTYHDVNLT